MSKPRLLFISNLFPDAAEPYRGLDNATVLHHLADRFDIRALSPRPTLWGNPPRQPRPVDLPFQPHYLPARYIPKIGHWNHHLMAAALRQPLAELRRRWPFEVVLSSWIFPDSCAVAALAHDFPLVSIAQGSDVHQYLKIPARRRVIASTMQRASGIITRSAALAGLLAQAGLNRERLHPIYNGIDFDTFHPADQADARRELGLPAEALKAPIILFVGNFLPIKNPRLLLEAHALLSGVHLVLIGGGPMEAELRTLAETLGSSSRIHFAGRKRAAEVARYMQAADTLALPSRNEGVPNVILEAFACGLPVVASDVGGIHEVHEQPHLGSLVRSGDLAALTTALRQTLATTPDRKRIHAHARKFNWEDASAQYAALLNRTIAEG